MKIMNSWFTVKVKYTKQMDDGTFKRVSEPYLLASMTFTDAEARIYNELGELIRGEFLVTGITRTDVHDIFHYDDSDVWFNCKIKFESGDGGEEGSKAKKVTQAFLVTAHSVEEAYQRLQESLGGMLIDFQITKIILSPIVDVFPFEDQNNLTLWCQSKELTEEELANAKLIACAPELLEFINEYKGFLNLKDQKKAIELIKRATE
jgi:hypothetical protein